MYVVKGRAVIGILPITLREGFESFQLIVNVTKILIVNSVDVNLRSCNLAATNECGLIRELVNFNFPSQSCNLAATN